MKKKFINKKGELSFIQYSFHVKSNNISFFVFSQKNNQTQLSQFIRINDVQLSKCMSI